MHTDLWNFALKLYARPGVEAACLQWQDQGGDVCLLLCAAWLDARAVAPSEDRVQALRELAGIWQRDVVKPLRSLRQQWREAAARDPQLASVREQVKGLELESERILLERLQKVSERWEASAEPRGDWLQCVAPRAAGLHHDALQKLRVVMQSAQDTEDGV